MSTQPIEIRAATPEDYPAFASLFDELGIDDPTPARGRFEAALRPRMFVAVEGARVVGYALHELLEGVGYVRNLVTAPDHRRRGIGRELMEHLRRLFDDHGASTWCLNVEPSNEGAIALYRRCGLDVAYDARSLRFPMDVARPRESPGPALEIGAIDPEQDAELERRFGLIPGQLASAREQAGRELLVFASAGQPVGLAVFDPSFPGAFPFRLEQPELALAIIAYFRRRAPSRARWVQVVVEDDEPLTAYLLEHGATMALHFVHMRGPLRTVG